MGRFTFRNLCIISDHPILSSHQLQLLGTTAAGCVGQQLQDWVLESMRDGFTQALNDAARSSRAQAWSVPIFTRLTFIEGLSEAGDEATGRYVGAEVSISAWFATDQMFSETTMQNSLDADTPVDENMLSPHNMADARGGLSPSTTPTTENIKSVNAAFKQAVSRNQPAMSNAPPIPLHEAYFTLSLTPTATRERRMSPSDAQLSKADVLRDSLLHTLDLPIMALSRDGTTVVRNLACDHVLQYFVKKNPGEQPAPPTEPDPNAESTLVDLSWLTDGLTCYTEDFSQPFPPWKFPIYRAAVLGERPPAVVIGCVSPDTGARRVLRVEGQPIRDAGGFGDHVGGVIVMKDLTEEYLQKKAAAKAQGQEYFKSICQSLAQLVWVTDPTGYHEWYNQQWYDFTGATEEQCVGVGWQGAFHPEDVPESSRRWSHSLRTGDLYSVEYRCRRRDGQWRWMLGRALPLRDPDSGAIVKWFGTCTDIHDTVEALAASRQSQDRLESVINHAAMTLWAVDTNGIITVAEGPGVRQLKLMGPGTPGSSEHDSGSGSSGKNQASGSQHSNQQQLQNRPGLSHLHSSSIEGSEDDNQPQSPSGTASQTTASKAASRTAHRKHNRSMIGKSIYSVWGEAPRVFIERALAGEASVEESEIEGRWFRTQYAPIREEEKEDGPGAVIGVVGASMDVTDRRRAQEQMEQSLRDRAKAKASESAAREASRLKSEFLANMSHEIRTPIAGVIGLSELLLDTRHLTAEARDLTENIQRSADALLTVINDVLDFSKVEIGKLDIEKTPFSLNLVCRDTIKMLSFATSKKGLTFAEHCDLRHQGLLLGDAGRVRQVLTNLLTNAIKFTEAGSISLAVNEVAEDATNITVRFDVQDTGCGISKEALSRLFQPFSQADPSTARRFGGTGLGLTICKNLVELMKGQIGLESQEGVGSRAWFSIPFEKARTTISELSEANVAASAAFNGNSMGVSSDPLQRARSDIWILVAEDNAINAQIAVKTLKKIGFSARTAENGRLALEELQKNPYDLVLMDCQMPEMDGYVATTHLRQSENPEIRALPVVALTASAIKGDRERALTAGMNDYLSKPVKRPALESMLSRWLFDHATRQTLSKFLAPLGPEVDRRSSMSSTSSSFDLTGLTPVVPGKKEGAAASIGSWSSHRGSNDPSDNVDDQGNQRRQSRTQQEQRDQQKQDVASRKASADEPSYFPPVADVVSSGDLDSMMEEAAAYSQSEQNRPSSEANGLLAALERSGTANTAALAAAIGTRRTSVAGFTASAAAMATSRSNDAPSSSFARTSGHRERTQGVRFASRPSASLRAHSYAGNKSPSLHAAELADASASTPRVDDQYTVGQLPTGRNTSVPTSGVNPPTSSQSPPASTSSGRSRSGSNNSVPPSAMKRPAPLLRRSSRAQGGMGRDLNEELIRASEGSSTGLGPILVTPPDEEPPAALGTVEQIGEDQTTPTGAPQRSQDQDHTMS